MKKSPARTRRPSLVSVIIPAFNDDSTLGETLSSVCNQTHKRLEIIVVDDGSSDGTAKLVREAAAVDNRISLVEQPNAGVAAARNRGAATATGEYLAFIDADDLWRPTKIERQLDVFAQEDESCGLVYTRFALIDSASNVLDYDIEDRPAGSVYEALAQKNFVGNGSSVLIRRDVFEVTSGYDSSLRAAGGEGCEDWKLYCHIASTHRFGFVDEALTGYRTLPDNMSSNVRAMIRSRDLVVSELRQSRPELERQFRAGRNHMARYMLHRALRERRWTDAAWLAKSMADYDFLFLCRTALGLPVKVWKLAARKSAPSKFGHFIG